MLPPIKSKEDIQKMRIAGKLATRVLDYISPYAIIGVSTGELDRLCHEYILANDASPAPLNYTPTGYSPYPKATCTSINHQVCHGVPDFERYLKDGDILNIDVTVIKDGWHGDTGRMFLIGSPSIMARRLCKITKESLWCGIRAVRPGAHVGDIGAAIQSFSEGNGYSVVRDFCGHGLGRDFHEVPQILHYGRHGEGVELKHNMVFTIEPMINVGKAAVKILADGWTAVTRDRSLSAQWEHTVRVSEDGYEVLTIPDDEENLRFPT